MKKMKKIKFMILTSMMCFSFISFGQSISHDDVTSGNFEVKNGFVSYTAKDNHVYKIGDTLKIGYPSDKKYFKYIQQMTIAGDLLQMGALFSGNNAIIKKIRVSGTKRSGFKINIQTKGNTALDNFFIDFENAIESGEIKSFGLTSDQALSELKKAKDKLELGLISEEEYNKKKEELIKYIK